MLEASCSGIRPLACNIIHLPAVEKSASVMMPKRSNSGSSAEDNAIRMACTHPAVDRGFGSSDRGLHGAPRRQQPVR
jgi:hypothetical protein